MHLKSIYEIFTLSPATSNDKVVYISFASTEIIVHKSNKSKDALEVTIKGQPPPPADGLLQKSSAAILYKLVPGTYEITREMFKKLNRNGPKVFRQLSLNDKKVIMSSESEIERSLTMSLSVPQPTTQPVVQPTEQKQTLPPQPQLQVNASANPPKPLAGNIIQGSLSFPGWDGSSTTQTSVVLPTNTVIAQGTLPFPIPTSVNNTQVPHIIPPPPTGVIELNVTPSSVSSGNFATVNDPTTDEDDKIFELAEGERNILEVFGEFEVTDSEHRDLRDLIWNTYGKDKIYGNLSFTMCIQRIAERQKANVPFNTDEICALFEELSSNMQYTIYNVIQSSLYKIGVQMKKNQELNNEILLKDANLAKLNRKLNSPIKPDDKLLELQNKIAEHERNIQTKESELQQAALSIQKLTEEKSRLETKTNNLEKEYQAVEDKMTEFKCQVEKLSTEKQTLASQFDDFKMLLDGEREKVKTLEHELTHYKNIPPQTITYTNPDQQSIIMSLFLENCKLKAELAHERSMIAQLQPLAAPHLTPEAMVTISNNTNPFIARNTVQSTAYPPTHIIPSFTSLPQASVNPSRSAYASSATGSTHTASPDIRSIRNKVPIPPKK